MPVARTARSSTTGVVTRVAARSRAPGSVVRDAADCRNLIDGLGLSRVHIVGYSYSGAVGLQLAADAAEHVQTLTLIEPPPVHMPSSAEFRAANARLQEVRRARGPGAAQEESLAHVIGPDWRTEVEQRLPGAAEQMQRDTTTFFDTDLPALLSWRFDAEDARRINCPVLHISGSDSGPWFAESESWSSPGCRRPKTSCSLGPITPWPLRTHPRSQTRSQTFSAATRSWLVVDRTDPASDTGNARICLLCT